MVIRLAGCQLITAGGVGLLMPGFNYQVDAVNRKYKDAVKYLEMLYVS